MLPPTVRTACISQNISKFDPKFAASWQNKWPRAFDIHGVRKFCTQSRSVRFICAAESRASWLAPKVPSHPVECTWHPGFLYAERAQIDARPLDFRLFGSCLIVVLVGQHQPASY